MISAKPLAKYKHVSREWVDAFASGRSIQLATYSYYRTLQNQRADREEGVSRNNLSYKFEANNPVPIERHAYVAPFVAAGLETFDGQQEGPITYEECDFVINYPQDYLICCSNVPNFR